MAQLNSQSGDTPRDGESGLQNEGSDGETQSNGETQSRRPDGETENETDPDGDAEENSGSQGGDEVPENIDPVLSRPLLLVAQPDTVSEGATEPVAPSLGASTPVEQAPKKRGIMSGVDWRKYAGT